ncbi:MAG: hypothetical protein ABSA47_04710 [Verrucomicrobiota bacterium]|jgi:hypothetical protein
MARWYSANVLQTMPGGRRLWRFSAKGDRFVFEAEKTLTLSETAPVTLVGKDWQSLVWPKLNVAWLPADKVFFRAVQLPGADAAEIAAMLELQLEKLSPLPVTHVVWSYYLAPRPATAKPDALQNVIVVIASRAYVEEYLGELQLQGFQPDRIESPALDQLLAARMNGDGVWIFPGAQGDPVLMVWQYAGSIHNVTLLPLPPGPERAAQIKAHIEQIAWAGELEGWLTQPPRIHLVAAPAEAAAWEPLFKPWADAGVEIIPPASPADLAAQSAERAGRDGATTNLLPPEFTARYHQQLVDRLWMRGVLSVVAVYLFGVLVYFGFLYGLGKQLDHARQEVARISADFTNAAEDELQITVLKNRQNLKYAALDCWKAVAENLPETVTLEDMYFSHDKFDLRGSSTSEQMDDITTFNDALRHAQDTARGVPLFTDVGPPTTSTRPGKTDWRFSCKLQSGEGP